jgi:hypothetical protein
LPPSSSCRPFPSPRSAASPTPRQRPRPVPRTQTPRLPQPLQGSPGHSLTRRRPSNHRNCEVSDHTRTGPWCRLLWQIHHGCRDQAIRDSHIRSMKGAGHRANWPPFGQESVGITRRVLLLRRRRTRLNAGLRRIVCHRSPRCLSPLDLREPVAKARENWLHRGALRSIGQFVRVFAQVVELLCPIPFVADVK